MQSVRHILSFLIAMGLVQMSPSDSIFEACAFDSRVHLLSGMCCGLHRLRKAILISLLSC